MSGTHDAAAVRARLAALCERHRLDEHSARRLERLLELLNDPRAPTAVHEPLRGIDVHVADSLSALEVAEVRATRRLADIGSGAGPPGAVLAIALPEARVALVESVERKAKFLRRLVGELELSNVDVVAERVEAWRDGLGSWDTVTARAVAPLAVLCEYAAPLLATDGSLVAFKGAVTDAEAAAGASAAEQLGLTPAGVREVRPFPDSRTRSLHVYRKTASTPDRFPRRPGVARKRPLGAG